MRHKFARSEKDRNVRRNARTNSREEETRCAHDPNGDAKFDFKNESRCDIIVSKARLVGLPKWPSPYQNRGILLPLSGDQVLLIDFVIRAIQVCKFATHYIAISLHVLSHCLKL